MTRDQALAKIKKCLALSRSSNEAEAAAAMRQAQALMRQHSIEGTDVELDGVAEHKSKARCAALNRWESDLAHCVGEAFDCQHFWLKTSELLGTLNIRHVRYVVFVGMGTAPQVASYAHDVLSRQCAKARLEHMRRQPKACKRITLTARGDQFALGWVLAVRRLVDRFAGDPKDQPLIAQYIAAKHPGMTSVKPRNNAVGRNTRDEDLYAGIQAGKQAQLNHGVAGSKAQLLEGSPA